MASNHKSIESYSSEEIDSIYKKQKRARWISIIIFASTITISTIWIYISNQVISSNSRKISELKAEASRERDLMAALKLNSHTLQSEIEILNQRKEVLLNETSKRLNISTDSIEKLSTNPSIEKGAKATKALKDISKNHVPSSSITIWYYMKSQNQKKILNALGETGYILEAKDSKNKVNNYESNALWFGAKVPLDDVKIVALALVAAGVELKGIRLYEASDKNPEYKANIIEIGCDANLIKLKALSTIEIKNAQGFSR